MSKKSPTKKTSQVQAVENHKINLEFDNHRKLSLLCGPHHVHIRKIEEHLQIQIFDRGNHLSLHGDNEKIKLAREIILSL